MTIKKTTQHTPSWLEERGKEAVKKFDTLSAPQKDKQDIGMIDVSLFSLDIVSKRELQDEIKIISLPKDIVCLSLLAAAEHSLYGSLVKKYYGTLLPLETKNDALHYVSLLHSFFVFVPKKTTGKIPLRLERNTYEPISSFHILLIAEAESDLTVILEEKSTGKQPGFVSTFVESVLAEHAHITFVSLEEYDHNKQHYIRKNATVAKDAKMEWIEAYFGSLYTKTTVTAHLAENGATATNTTLFFGEEKQKFDITAQTYQHAPHTFVDMNTIGVVTDTARSMCRGLIKIDQPAYSSAGNQKIKTLLMNKDAQANAIPSMQIDNFDVHATHESSVGQISKDKLFYLMSRGLDEKKSTGKNC